MSRAEKQSDIRSRNSNPARVTNPHRDCELYVPGHVVHWIQAIRSASLPHLDGHLVGVEDGLVVVIDIGGEIRRYRNHDIEHLVGLVDIGDPVRVCESSSILRRDQGGGASCFSIAKVVDAWRPCESEPITDVSPEGLARRLETHGGFAVAGSEVLKTLGRGPAPDP